MTDNHEGEKQVVVVRPEGKPQSKREECFSDSLHAYTVAKLEEKGRPELWSHISPDLEDEST